MQSFRWRIISTDFPLSGPCWIRTVCGGWPHTLQTWAFRCLFIGWHLSFEKSWEGEPICAEAAPSRREQALTFRKSGLTQTLRLPIFLCQECSPHSPSVLI